jgi:hypothetical protein
MLYLFVMRSVEIIHVLLLLCLQNLPYIKLTACIKTGGKFYLLEHIFNNWWCETIRIYQKNT